MVHRPSDSRLLANLLNHEKEYTKQLLGLLDSSHVLLASFSAYAAASAPPASNAIIAVAGTLSGADDALRRYAGVVDTWREQLKELKDMEDDVGIIMRDREILVARLIKASKSKPNRDSFAGFAAAASGSSTSLKSDFSSSLAFNLNTSAKLSAAQAELQACEAHLAIKERELDERRASAVKDGLSARCRALTECGWAWGEMGKEGLRALETLLNPKPTDGREVPEHPTSPSRFYSKSLPDPAGCSSPDNCSIAPSQSASNIALPLPPTAINGDHPYAEEAEQRSGTVSPSPNDIPATNKTEDPGMITPRVLPTGNGSGSVNPNPDVKHTPYLPANRPFSRHITEESEGEQGHAGESSDEDDMGNMTVVQNPRFADGTGKGFSVRGGTRAAFSFPAATASDVAIRSPARDERRRHGFFGSIRGLFRGGQKEREDVHESDSDEENERKRSGTFFGREGDGKWVTRTDRNLKAVQSGMGQRAQSDDEGPARAARMVRTDSERTERTGTQKLRKSKGPPKSKRERPETDKTVVGSNRDQQLAARQMGEQSVDRWINHREFGEQEKGTSSGKSKGPTKKTKPKPRGDVQAGTKSFTTNDSPFYLAPTSKHDTTVSDSHLPMGGGLSRDNSVGRGSIMSAPITARTRRASTMSNTMNNSGSGFSNGTTPRRVNSVQISTVDKPKPKRPSQSHDRNRSMGGNVVVNGVNGNGGQSLMSIVEDVSKANREGWKTHKASQSLPHAQGPSSGLGSIDIPKAPARVTRTTLDAAPKVQVPFGTMVLPRAPGSVIQVNGDSQVTGNGVTAQMSPVIAAPVPIVPDSPSSGMFGSTSSLGPPRPLKSALRTPSPNPQMLPQARRSVDIPISQNRAAAERADRRTSVGQNGLDHFVPTKDKEADEMSTSSYETGHEDLDEEDMPPPPPPPHDEPPSDISASTTSTQTTIEPARRKSVRVSLQPTFSATPPALDDDESHAPWGGREETTWGRKRGAVDGEKDLWEDSSEEDEEYRQARRLLLRVGKRKSKN